MALGLRKTNRPTKPFISSYARTVFEDWTKKDYTIQNLTGEKYERLLQNPYNSTFKETIGTNVAIAKQKMLAAQAQWSTEQTLQTFNSKLEPIKGKYRIPDSVQENVDQFTNDTQSKLDTLEKHQNQLDRLQEQARDLSHKWYGKWSKHLDTEAEKLINALEQAGVTLTDHDKMDLTERLTKKKEQLPFKDGIAPPTTPNPDDLSTLDHVTEVVQQKFMREGMTPDESTVETRMVVGKPNVRKTIDDYDTSNNNFAKQAEQAFRPIFEQIEMIRKAIEDLRSSLGDNLEGKASQVLNDTQIQTEKAYAQEQKGAPEEEHAKQRGGRGFAPPPSGGGKA